MRFISAASGVGVAYVFTHIRMRMAIGFDTQRKQIRTRRVTSIVVLNSAYDSIQHTQIAV